MRVSGAAFTGGNASATSSVGRDVFASAQSAPHQAGSVDATGAWARLAAWATALPGQTLGCCVPCGLTWGRSGRLAAGGMRVFAPCRVCGQLADTRDPRDFGGLKEDVTWADAQRGLGK